MTVTRSTRSSQRLSATPSTELQAPATASKRKSTRERTPKPNTPRSKRKPEPKSARRLARKSTPAPEEEEEEEETGLFFTRPELFKTPSRAPNSQQPPAENSTRQSTKATLTANELRSRRHARVEVIDNKIYTRTEVQEMYEKQKEAQDREEREARDRENQELYDRISAQGITAYNERLARQREEEEAEQSRAAAADQTEAQVEEGAAVQSEQPVEKQTSTVAAPAPETPKRRGWGWGFTPLKSVMNFFTPARSSQTAQAPATAPPARRLAPEEEQEIHDALIPDVLSRRKAPQTVKPKSRTQTNGQTRKKTKSKSKRAPDSVLVKRALESIDPRHHDKAREWVEQTALKYAEDIPGNIGDKRKRLESGLSVGHIDEIPAHYPWEKGGAFGLLEEFDDSDDEAPAWYVLEQLANNRPVKRRKSAHNTTVDEDIPSLNDLSNQPLLFNSHGNSASLRDYQPRSSRIPSPMFDFPDVHQDQGNVFTESFVKRPTPEGWSKGETEVIDRISGTKKAQDPPKLSKSEQQKRTGHVEGSGSFCVPESDSDSDPEENVEPAEELLHGFNPAWLDKPSQPQRYEGPPPPTDNEPAWLKRTSQPPEQLLPPPPPTPAHATLPSPIKASPIVPPVQRETSPAREDPVKAERARAMKYTPAKPSRLREAMLPSPSLLSDAGNDSIIAFHDDNTIILNDDDGMPQYMPLDLDMDIEEYVTNLVGSESFKTGAAAAWGGSDVILRYDDEDDDL